jgi:tripartite-type tricarboxylate transporter receptor subunit TctC
MRRKRISGGALMNRRTLIAALTGVAAVSLAAAAAAQTPDDYPNRPIRIIVTQAAGSGVDQQARVLAQKMGELWGQQGWWRTVPGANAIIGMEAGAKAAPDGYTLVYAPVSAVTTNALHLQEAALRSACATSPRLPDGPPTRWVRSPIRVRA